MNELRAAGPFQLVACDMNLHPSSCAGIVLSLCEMGVVERGARLILTLKFVQKRGSGPDQLTAAAVALLDPQFSDIRVRPLFSNGSHEATLMAIKN